MCSLIRSWLYKKNKKKNKNNKTLVTGKKIFGFTFPLMSMYLCNTFFVCTYYSCHQSNGDDTPPHVVLFGLFFLILSFLSRSLADRWGTTVDFTTSFLHSLWFSALRSMIFHSKRVHSLMLSSHRFLCLPLRPPP